MHRNLMSLIAAGALALCGSSALAADAAPAAMSQQSMIARQGDLLSLDRLGSVRVGEFVTLADLPLSQTESVTVELERFNNLAPNAKLVVVGEDGVERPLPDLGVKLFRGSVIGDPDALVFVSVSPHGTNGFIEHGGKLLSISTGPYAKRAEFDLPVRITDAATVLTGDGPAPACGVEFDSDRILELAPNGLPDVPADGAAAPRDTSCHVADIAVETDYEYTNKHFGGNTTASAAYAQSLFAAISEIYERDFNTALQVSFLRVWASNNDPYETSTDPLDDVRGHWNSNMSGEDRTIVHYLTGQDNTSYGGVAYLSVLCYNNYGYGVSVYLDGSFPYPLVDYNYGNWDLVVCAHEMGHNFGTGHTHDSYSPPIDNCGNGDCSGNTQSTIMSYCHTCSGGLTNIRLGFHSRVITVVTNYIASVPGCLPPQTGGSADAVDDSASTFETDPVEIDVLVNDTSGDCAGISSIASHDSTSTQGGSVALSFNGTLGRDVLTYTAPIGFDGLDSFTYTVDGPDTATVTVDVGGYRDADNPANTIPGLFASYYSWPSQLSTMPDVSALTPDFTETVADLNIASSAAPFGNSGLFQTFAAVYEGYVQAPVRGVYTFYTESDDGSLLYIGDEMVVDNNGLHGMQTQSGEIALEAGVHALRVEFFENIGNAGLIVSMKYPPITDPFVIPAIYLFSDGACPADINGDGFLNLGDVTAFIDAFTAGDSAADMNGDGFFNLADVTAFIDAFVAGC